MPRRTRKQMLAERQDPAAPYLFDEQHLPLRPDVVELVKQGHHRHTGARLLENEKLCLRLAELLMAKWGIKRIARELGVSKWTVRASRDALVARGEMAPWKERVVEIFSEIVEVGASNYREALENDAVPVAQLPVGVGIFADKRSDALGEPHGPDLARNGAGVTVISVERVLAWVKSLPSLDSQSVGPQPVSEQTGVRSGPDAILDATLVADLEGGGGGSKAATGLAEQTNPIERNETTKEGA